MLISLSKPFCAPCSFSLLHVRVSSELPENAKCMMDCEAFEILEGIKEQLYVLSEDPTIKTPVSLDRGLGYLKYGEEGKITELLAEALTKLPKLKRSS
ncbi:unnamed protein product [Eruca vesicaria subsp. sativa]|uniref:Uncharacterized protein n=1 Tax=Eruca vesicaria subsp. sativa TaxID=29727 RepID=A0ABC8LZ24_ERUVS|nr:unnamed protein product [Eruca vesicaria subsp. sativa]